MAKRSDIPEFGMLRGIKVVHSSTVVAGPIAAELMAEMGADVIWIESTKSFDTNRGKGGALKSGFRYLLEHADSSSQQGAVTADADGQHTVPDIRCVMDEMERAPEALVLGVRMFEGRVPFRSAFGNRLTRFLLRLLYGVRIPDTQTGLRGIPRTMMERCLKIPSDRYEFELDMLLAAVSDGIGIRSVPIRTVYINDNASSHFHPLRDSARIYSVLFRNLFRKQR